jgi:hypothetical protein
MRHVRVVYPVLRGGRDSALLSMVIAGLLGITGDGAAQPSAECGPGPCIQVGLEDAAHGSTEIADAADHFAYCPEGETVELDFLAVFTSGTSCDTTCPHPNRTLQWTVSGATSSQITTYPTSIPEQHTYLSEVQITLAEAGDTITVTCTVGDTNANQECEEDDPRKEYEHSGSHAGASAILYSAMV